jgi:outer membrane lipoprotein carrier protein
MMKIWYSLLFTLCCSPALAQTALEQLKTFTASTKSARGEFTQRVVKAGVPGSPATGNFAFSRPGKFRWVYVKPYEQSLIADGEKLWIYDKDLNQVTIKKLGTALGESPAAILFGSNDLEKNFNLSEGGTRDGIEWLQAIPKTKDTNFEKIGIGLKDGVPVAMELRDSFGQISVLSFTRFEKNPSFSSNQFRFVMPKGADVLQQ